MRSRLEGGPSVVSYAIDARSTRASRNQIPTSIEFKLEPSLGLDEDGVLAVCNLSYRV